MKKLNQKGFHLTFLLVVLVAAGVIFTGVYVYNKQNEQKPQETTIVPTKDSKEEVSIVSGFDKSKCTTNTLPKFGLTYCYPKQWKVEDYSNEDIPLQLLYESQDYAESQDTGINIQTDGGKFAIIALKSHIANVDEIKAGAAGDYFTYKSTTSISGKPAAKGACGHHSPGVCVYVPYNGYLYEFSYTQPNRNINKDAKAELDKYKTEYQEFLNSVVLTTPTT